MLAVIADDFTGAAELAGIGRTHGLTVEIAMTLNLKTQAELLVVATDTRSVSEPEAVRAITAVCRALHRLKPQLIYKKIDSVLRGHVIAETRAMQQVLDLSKALLVSANPALGRTLVNGQYYVEGELIHQTHFADDPEFPVTESDVSKRLSRSREPVFVQSSQKPLPQRGIVVGEVEKPADFKAWIYHLDPETLVGGGSGFFSAVLDSLALPKTQTAVPFSLGQTRLYVCGSAFNESVELVRKAVEAGHSVHYMPKSLGQNSAKAALETWAAETAESLRQNRVAILAIDPRTVEKPDAVQLRTMMAKTVQQIINRVLVNELVIEGGSTASAILREIGVMRLVPTQELAPGVVRCATLENDSLHITVKPGSYRWSPELWTF
ncbi:hypothetical protein GCM10027299_22800 [Larkinella ripae]